ncbi:MerC domain-containing protein [Henriciella litoralis]|uniref:MerC domain-containing protein n=1 Tax=Henriciella litoralis TaxID=568102 RepID=UPI000A022C7F|nr:MerC domain-containing protein [Henriciella litoralis]
MTARVLNPRAIDASAITLSALCMIHCLALPLLAAMLPLASVWAEAEWVHKAFVLVAVPLSGFAIVRSATSPGGLGFMLLALSGLTLLIAAAFLKPLHEVETPVTVTGALLLASAHIWRWSRHRNSNAHEA